MFEKTKKITTVEILSACYALVWGGFVALPMIDHFPRYPKLFRPMVEIYNSEFFWGSLIFLTGLIAMFFILKNRKARAALILSMLYVSFGVLFLIGDFTSPAWMLFGLFAVFNFYDWRTSKWNSARA